MKAREEDMCAELFEKYQLAKAKCEAAGVKFALDCVIRTRAEQEALYAQGREDLDAVNAKRMTAGMVALPKDLSRIEGGVKYTYAANREKFKVTWTLNSKHFPDKDGKSRACDIYILNVANRPTWDLKFDGNADGISDYLEAAELARSCGLDCGAFWKGSKDYPHWQCPDA